MPSANQPAPTRGEIVWYASKAECLSAAADMRAHPQPALMVESPSLECRLDPAHLPAGR
jgi:hypothetical protein